MIGLGALYVVLMTAASVYLMLSRNTQRVVMGFVVLSNAVNLAVLIAAGLPPGAGPPLLGAEDRSGQMVDPLPHAFLLTAIVIGLGNAAYLMALASRLHQETGTDSVAIDGDGPGDGDEAGAGEGGRWE